MNILRRIKKSLRGQISARNVLREVVRLKRKSSQQKYERFNIEQIDNSPARLPIKFRELDEIDLLKHFRQKKFTLWKGNDDGLKNIIELQSTLYPEQTESLIENAKEIVKNRSWSLFSFEKMKFQSENFWRRDPVSGKVWDLSFHREIDLAQNNGSDIRLVWELNRFGQALTLARAFVMTKDESFAEEFFSQITDWSEQNPYGRGVNWFCAMEAALRAINLLAAFDIFRHSTSLTSQKLAEILKLFDLHGRFIFNNLEFSHISTSNHYLSDVIGLLWLGIFFPELEEASKWKEFGFREMLNELDKQILSDGGDFESSTGYHKFVTELILYSFILCENNGVEIPEKYRIKLHKMLSYIRSYLRPDGFAPLIGDTDGGQIIPIVQRAGNDHAYLLEVGAAFLNDAEFKIPTERISQEVLWLTGEDIFKSFQNSPAIPATSRVFPNAGAYIMREKDLYLYFNANDCGLNGRGSHGHNDALSIEVSAFGQPFIIDPGTFTYNSDLQARHLFRSTSYHSTVQIDESEQNTTETDLPFVIGNEAQPKILSWQTSPEYDAVSAEHYGYKRLKNGVIHRRSVEFYKTEGFWLIKDELSGKATHNYDFNFHLAPDLYVTELADGIVRISHNINGYLFICPFGTQVKPKVESAWVSYNYGERKKSKSLKWQLTMDKSFKLSFILYPMQVFGNEKIVLEIIKQIIDDIEDK